MNLPLQVPFPPMEARPQPHLPSGKEWEYEPKWDGFRCIAFGDADKVQLQSKAGKPLTRYFPEIVDALHSITAKRFVLDGEIVIREEGIFQFDELLQRIHPADSRVQRLAREHPAEYILFDLLVDERGRKLADKSFRERRRALEQFVTRYLKGNKKFTLSPSTTNAKTATKWIEKMHGLVDGIIAKRLDVPYDSGGRDAMQKIKWMKSADCVVGGFRYGKGSREVGSLLLGLYDDEGLLHHVGFTATIPKKERAALTKELEKQRGGSGFTGRAPGGPSRWNGGAESPWIPLHPSLVVEVQFDHTSGGRFRHGTKLLRRRPDKDPSQCTMQQLD